MLFISHKTEDKAAAEDLKQRALGRGYTDKQIFLDSDPGSGIEAGTAWESRIYESLKHTRAMIVLCSPNWLKSQWCFVELGYAKAMAISLFPIVIEKCDVGSTLSSTQAIDLTAARDNAAREEAFARLWTALEEKHLGPKDNLPWPPPGDTDQCPFPGLMNFDEKHAPVFFGRERERDTVIKQLKEMRSSGLPRLLLIVGGSGSGKSSLLRAGVLPWLRHPTEQRDWLVLPTLRYGESPNDDVTLLARLAEILAAHFPPDHPRRLDWKDLRNKFESDDIAQAARDFVDASMDLCQARQRSLALQGRASADALTVLLPIDQFEELLTAAACPSAQRFLRFLRTLLSRSNGRLLVVGTMRSDYLDVYEQHQESLKPPFLELYRLPPFPWERVAEVIVKPAERVDVTFTEELITRLKADAPTSDALPLLAFTLEKLFRQCADDQIIELHEYEQLGGMSGAISQAVARILPQNLPKETEHALRLSFVKRLAQINENDEFVRCRVLWDTLPNAAKPLLEEFVRRERLLQRSGNKGEFVEVTHEALFRCWDQLKKWLQDDLPGLRLRRRVVALAAEWQHSRNAANPQGDEGLLLTHAQLAAFDEWQQQGDLALPEVESNFVQASRDKRKSDEHREMERLQQLADAERKKQQAESQRADDAIRFSRRLTWAVIGTTAIALVAIVLGVVALKQQSIAKAETARAEFATQDSQGARASALAQIPGRATEALVLSIELVTPNIAANRPVPPQAFRGLVDAVVAVGYSIPRQNTLGGHTDAVNSVTFSPDGTRIITAGDDHTTRLWDAATLELLKTYPRPRVFRMSGVPSSAFSPDSSRIVIPTTGKVAIILDAHSGELIHSLQGHIDEVTFAAFSSDGRRIVTAGSVSDGTARLWDAESGELIRTFTDRGTVLFAVLSPNGKYLASGGQHQKTLLWDVNTGEKLKEFGEGNGWVVSGAFAPNSEFLMTSTEHGGSDLWALQSEVGCERDRSGGQMSRLDDHSFSERLFVMGPDVLELQSGELRHRFPRHTGNGVDSAGISRNGRYVATTTIADPTARVWNAETGRLKAILEGHEKSVTSCDFSPDGQSVVTSSADGTARLWNLHPDLSILTINDHSNAVESLAVSPDGTRMVSCSQGVAYVHDMVGTRIATLQGHVADIRSRAFAPDGTGIVACCEDHVVRVFDTNTGAVKFELRKHTGPVRSAVFAPDGSRILTASDDFTARVWDAGAGTLLQTLSGHSDAVESAVFSPDSSKIATFSTTGDAASRKGTVFIWDVNGVRLSTLDGQICSLTSDPFSRDGLRIVAASDGNTARLWDSRTGGVLQTLEGHDDWVKSATFSPNNSRIVTTSIDKTSRLWDPDTGRELATLRGHSGFVYQATFSPDSSRVITFGPDCSATMWDSKTGEPLAEFGGHSKSINSVAFFADGTCVVTASNDGQLKVFPASIEQFFSQACRMLQRRKESRVVPEWWVDAPRRTAKEQHPVK